jgi:excisionase family DNA binding protein
MTEEASAHEDLTALFVRLPVGEAHKLARAALELRTSKKDLVSALVARYVDPDDEVTMLGLRGLQAEGTGTRRKVVVEMGGDAPTVGRAVFFPNEPAEVLTAAQAAQLLQLDEEAVDQLASAGELPGRNLAGHWRFSRAALLRWLDGDGSVVPPPTGDLSAQPSGDESDAPPVP